MLDYHWNSLGKLFDNEIPCERFYYKPRVDSETQLIDRASFGFRGGILIEQTLAANLWAPRFFPGKKGPRHPLRPISRIRCKITRRLTKLGWHCWQQGLFSVFIKVATFNDWHHTFAKQTILASCTLNNNNSQYWIQLIKLSDPAFDVAFWCSEE